MKKSTIFWLGVLNIINLILTCIYSTLKKFELDILISLFLVIIFILAILLIFLNIAPFILADEYKDSYLYDKTHSLYKLRFLSLTYWLIIIPYKKYIIPFNNWLNK